jgi:replicative DNA helicase
MIHIREAVAQHKKYLDDKLAGRIIDLKTPWEKFNKHTGGFEIGTVMLYASPSGGGKTTFMIQLERNLGRLNPEFPVEVLCFSFEMLGRNIIARRISQDMKLQTRYINQNLTQGAMHSDHYRKIQEKYQDYAKDNVHYVENSMSVDRMSDIIQEHREDLDKKYQGSHNYILYIAIDHSVLILDRKGDNERLTLKRLGALCIDEKKIGNTIIVILSQTNGSLTNIDRLQNPQLQTPTQDDIFGGRALYFACDYVLISVNPEMWGLSKWTKHNLDTKDRLFWHIIKQREGKPITLVMKNTLMYSSIEEEKIE